ncbi:MAG: ASKHA domain-containing protein, partial [Candidatus Bathyarchaeia archaeon]
EALKMIPHAVREGDWAVTTITWMNQELISVKPREQDRSLYGLALDIGTTKLAAYLLNLDNGEISATVSMMNPQIPYGEDVISRISYIIKDEKNLEKLNRIIISGINELIEKACEKAGINPEDIYDMTVVGNTAMHHIFLGISPKYVSISPYPAALQSSIDVKARELGVRMNRGAYVHVLPTIAGFVGADAVADALATEVYRSEGLAMLVDIGTNTEIILGNKEKLLSCSCASGPAFEGAHIRHGMKAATGAIEHIWMDPETLEVGYKTIDDVKPSGLCGSAIVDALAGMLKAGIIAPEGNFNQDLRTPRLRRNQEKFEFVIAWADETSTSNDIVVTQDDVREVQLAKAAIYTGAAILMKHMNVDFRDIRKVFIAGAFGNYVDPQSAKIIGMFPDIPLQNVQFVGNTAGSGARMALLSTEMRRLAEEVAERIEYVELGADPDFQSEFIKATYLPHKEAELFPNVMRLLRRN